MDSETNYTQIWVGILRVSTNFSDPTNRSIASPQPERGFLGDFIVGDMIGPRRIFFFCQQNPLISKDHSLIHTNFFVEMT